MVQKMATSLLLQCIMWLRRNCHPMNHDSKDCSRRTGQIRYLLPVMLPNPDVVFQCDEKRTTLICGKVYNYKGRRHLIFL